MRMFWFLMLCFASSVLVQPVAAAELAVSSVFGSHAVLQSGMPVPVWGTAKPGADVAVSFAGQTVAATTGADGRWNAVLQPLKPSAEPQRMTVKDAATEIVFEDVLVGDVWLVCGRSNIGFGVPGMLNASNEIAHADQPLLRLMSVAEKDPSLAPKAAFNRRGWVAASSQGRVLSGFSAVGWVFGSELQKARKVPVGIVVSTWGGSRPALWIERSFYDARRAGAKKQSSADQAAFERQSQATDGQSAAAIGATPGACFNSHIHPLIPMAMKGAVVFFDGGEPEDMRLLAENWRARWALGDFPFIYIQVHRQGGPVEDDPNQKSDAHRSSYVELLKRITNSAMVVALDTGVQGARNIHPPNKRPVGERAALAARALAYGEKLVYSGPIVARVSAQGNTAIITFEHVGSGLEAKGGPLEGFAVSENGKMWLWGKALMVSNTVVVTADGLKAVSAVRYAYAPSNPKGNLYNREGLPASPFSRAAHESREADLP